MTALGAVFLTLIMLTVLATVGVPAWVLATGVIVALALPPVTGAVRILLDQLQKPPRPRT